VSMPGMLPRRRPDQAYNPPPSGQAPGQMTNVFRGRLIVIGGTSPPGSGIFVYSPTPAANNLIYSLAAQSGHDVYGNFVFQGETTYGAVGGINYALNSTAQGLEWFTSTTGQTGGAPYTSDFSVDIYDSTGLNDGNFGLSLGGVPAMLPPTMWQAPLLAQDPSIATPPTAESWHAMPLAAGWSNTANKVAAQYRLTTSNEAQVVGDVSHASFSGSSAISTALPNAYHPAHDQNSNCEAAATFHVHLDTAGILHVENAPAGSTRIIFNERFPLDA
jgi:hypothetical protein